MKTIDALSVEIAGIRMSTPVIAASGTFGFGLEYEDFVDLNEIGAISVKGTTLEPRAGNSGRRIAETPAGMMNAIGLENPGVEYFLKETLPKLRKYKTAILVNISGNTVEEYAALAGRLNVEGVAGLEVNISCPNVKCGGLAFGADPASAMSVVRAVRAASKKPVIVKLSPNVTDIASMALAVESAGADAISLINTLLGMAIDINTWKPVIGNVVAGLSGPAIKPVALRMTWQVAKAVKIPVIGMGGITSTSDAVEFFLAGASAVAVGTANFVDPAATVNIAKGLRGYLAEKGLTHINDLVGKLKV